MNSPIEQRPTSPLVPLPSVEGKGKEKGEEGNHPVVRTAHQVLQEEGVKAEKPPLNRIKAKEVKSELEWRKLRRMTSSTQNFLQAIPRPPSREIDLKPHKLGNSSNPVALLKQDRFIPTYLIQTNANSSSPSYEKLAKMPQYFDREGVISNLYLFCESNPNETLDLLPLIRGLSGSSEPYLAFDENFLKYLERQNFRIENLTSLTRNLVPYVKWSEIQDDQELKQAAQKAMRADMARPPYERKIRDFEDVVYKGGRENLREILASQKAALEGYDDILHLKKSVPTSDTLRIRWDQQGFVHPIKSNFLEGYQHISSAAWNSWGAARKEYDLAIFHVHQARSQHDGSKEAMLKQEQAEQKLEEAIARLQAEERKLADYRVDPASVCKLAFYETKINANDFHMEQLMIGPDPHHPEQNRMVSVDEGRWGPPGIAYPYSTSMAATLKNSLLTHPDALKPIPRDSAFRTFLKQRLEQIDQKAEEMKERGLVWSEAEFRELEEAYKNVNSVLNQFKRIGAIKDKDLPAIAQKYDIAYDTNLTAEQLRKKIADHFDAKKIALKEKAFEKQAERSLVQEMAREKRMAEYILGNPDATIYEAFEIGYPELKTFMAVMRRMEADPGKALAYKAAMGMLIPRPLSSIIQEAKKQNLASPEEIAQMEKDLKDIQQNGLVTVEAIALTSEAF